jgi:hypothetical protein
VLFSEQSQPEPEEAATEGEATDGVAALAGATEEDRDLSPLTEEEQARQLAEREELASKAKAPRRRRANAPPSGAEPEPEKEPEDGKEAGEPEADS